MPIYRYKCKECGTIYEEIFDRNSVKNRITCANCGTEAVIIPSSPSIKVMSEKRKEIIKQLTGREINSYKEEEAYMKQNNLISVSKKEWQEIKAKRDSMWNSYNYNRDKIQSKMVEGIKRVIENREERIKINLYNREKKEEARNIINKNYDGVEI